MHVVTLYLINRVSLCMECVKFGEQLFSWFCPFTLWVLDAELGLSGLEANAFFTHRTISLAPSIYLIFFFFAYRLSIFKNILSSLSSVNTG